MHVWLFDIDGTLIDTDGAGRKTFGAVISGQFGITDLVGRVSFSGRTDRAIAGDLFRAHGIEDSTENWSRFQDAYFSELGSKLASCKGRVLPGVVELLESLERRADCKLGLLTGNVRAGAQQKLAHYGLEQHFAFGGFGNMFTNRNDVASEAASAACDFLGLSPDRVCFHVIGDTPDDVRCARSIGATAIAVSTGKFTQQQLASTSPDLLLEDLRNSAPLFELIK